MALFLDGNPLDDATGRFYVLATSRLRNPPAVVVNDLNVPGRHGLIPTNSGVYGPGTAVLTMRVRGGSYTAMMASYTALMAAVGLRSVQRTLYDSETLQSVSVQLTTVSELEQNHRKMATCTVTFAIPRAFWRDASDITVDLGTTAGNKNPAELQGGSAPIMDPVFVTVGNGASTDFRVTDNETGTYFRWVGTATSQSVRIEPDTASAWLAPTASPWNGGTDVSGLLTVGPGQFVLSPYSGFTIAKTGTTNTQVRARRAYL